MLAEDGREGLDDKQKDTTTGSETEDLGRKALVQGTEALLASDADESGVGPLASGVELQTRLDDIEGSVDDSTDETTDGTGGEVVTHLLVLGLGLGKESLDLEDRTEVTTVPPPVTPESGLHALVDTGDVRAARRSQNTISYSPEETVGLDDLLDNVEGASVGRGLVLETDLDQLKGGNDKRLGGTGEATSEEGDALGGLLLAAVSEDRAPPA